MGQVVAAAIVVLVAAVTCVTVNVLRHEASSALWGIYSVDPGRTLISPDGHWQARLLDEGFLLDDEWNKVQVRPSGTAAWREVGSSYDWDASMRWSGSARLVVSDEGSRYAIAVVPAYRRAAPSLLARIASPLIAPFLRGIGQIVGLVILIVGLLSVFAIPPWTDRIAARKLVNEVLTCLREGDTWAATSLVCSDDPAFRAQATRLEQSLRISKLAQLSRSRRTRAHILTRVSPQSNERTAYGVDAQFLTEGKPALVEHAVMGNEPVDQTVLPPVVCRERDEGARFRSAERLLFRYGASVAPSPPGNPFSKMAMSSLIA